MAWMKPIFKPIFPVSTFNFIQFPGPASWTAGEKLQQPCTVVPVSSLTNLQNMFKHLWLKPSSQQRDLASHPAKTLLTSAESSIASYSLIWDFPRCSSHGEVFHITQVSFCVVSLCAPVFNHWFHFKKKVMLVQQ